MRNGFAELMEIYYSIVHRSFQCAVDMYYGVRTVRNKAVQDKLT
jgi:hypothetical protein